MNRTGRVIGKISVELRGFEPLTPCMPCKCATSCAIAPNFISEIELYLEILTNFVLSPIYHHLTQELEEIRRYIQLISKANVVLQVHLKQSKNNY